MPDRIPEIMLSRLSEIIEEHMGLWFPRRRWPELLRAVERASLRNGVHDATSFLSMLLSRPSNDGRLESLATHLTVAETYFFRDGKLFRLLEEKLLPLIIADRRSNGRHLRIWSAGCSTGEEPYSLAIAIDRLLPDIADWRVEIIATDVNPLSIEHASAGIYTDWSFRGGASSLKNRYFKPVGDDHYEISPKIKHLVRFSCHNLIRDPWTFGSPERHPIDIIFCRNVLMYFSPEKNRQVIDQFCGCLHEGGLLIVAPAELETFGNPELEIVRYPGVSLYKKRGTHPACFDEQVGFSSDSLTASIDHNGSRVRESSRSRTQIRDHFASTSGAEGASSNVNRKGEVAGRIQPQKPILNEALSTEKPPAFFKTESVPTDHLEQEEEVSDYSLRAREHANKGELAEALDWCEKALACDRLEPDGYCLHGNILQEQGKLDEAIVSFKKALYLDQEMIVARFSLGNLYRRLGKSNESDIHFEAALELLKNREEDEVVLRSEGITARRLLSIIESLIHQEIQHG